MEADEILKETSRNQEQVQEQVQAKIEIAKKAKSERDALVKLDELEGDIKRLRAKLIWHDSDTKSSVLDQLRERLQAKQVAGQEAKRAYDAAAGEVIELGDMDAIKGRIGEAERELEEISGEVQQKTVDVTNQQKEINSTNTALKRLTAARAEQNQRLKSVTAEVSTYLRLRAVCYST